jgi:hypothetical protein
VTEQRAGNSVFAPFLRAGSSVNRELARHALDDPLAGEAVGPDPPWEAPLAFFAALHYLALSGEAPRVAAAYRGDEPIWPAARHALEEHFDFVRRFVRERPVQTNEVGRCWALLPLFLLAAWRASAPVVDVIELGASAGLNLYWDRYHYVYPGLEWGPEAPVVLAGDWRGPFPAEALDAHVSVRRRVGIDRSPIDVTTDEGALLLQSFLWADQPERLERQRSAIEVMRRDPPRLVRANYLDALPSVLAEADPEVLTIVFSSASMQYVSDEEFARVDVAIADATTPVAWATMEPARGTDDYGHFVLSLDREVLADVQYHGAWVEWR